MKQFKQAGFSLVELMIATLLAVLIAIAIVVLWANTERYAVTKIRSDRMNAELQAALTVMANDIRRAGYWSNAATNVGTSLNNNIFASTGALPTNITISSVSPGSNNCISFAYDINKNNSIAAGSYSNSARMVYRLKNGAIQASVSSTHASCADISSYWQNLTNPDLITVTALTFTLNTSTITLPSGHTLTIRRVDISTTAQLASNSSIKTTLFQTVKVRADLYT